MPSLLSDAYGSNIAKHMQSASKFNFSTTPAKKKPPSSVGAVAPSVDNTSQISTFQKNGNYEIHITIDRHDCHLLCLFIGVFTLSVLFNSNKTAKSPASA